MPNNRVRRPLPHRRHKGPQKVAKHEPDPKLAALRAEHAELRRQSKILARRLAAEPGREDLLLQRDELYYRLGNLRRDITRRKEWIRRQQGVDLDLRDRLWTTLRICGPMSVARLSRELGAAPRTIRAALDHDWFVRAGARSEWGISVCEAAGARV